jgi:anti-sigma-K factor RskA
MNLGDPARSARLDALASQYALGTLSARARRRLASAARVDAAVAARIAEWDNRLSAFAAAIPPVTPAPRVWDGVRSRLGLRDDHPRPAREPWWQNVGWWRALAAVAFALVVALGVVLLAPTVEAPAGQVVVVLAGDDARPAMIATAGRGSRYLSVKAVAPLLVAPDRALELWMLPQGQDPRSLGLVPASGVGQVALAAPAERALRDIPALAVSLEPSGGSPTGRPTGPVLYSGAVQRIY